MSTKRGKFILTVVLITMFTAIFGLTYAAFSDKGKVLGSSFKVGSSDLKLLEVLSGGTDDSNLKDELTGPAFTNIVPDWQQDYLLKIYNNGSSTLHITSNAFYETANDPDELRNYIFVEPIEWIDINGNGTLESGEEGASFGKKNITKWKTEGFDMGTMEKAGTKGLILRFTATTLSDTKQGKTGVFDFEFNAIQE